jgi:uncharacterized LabA/DUF88 family protein
VEEALVFIDAGFLSKVSKHFWKGAPFKYNIVTFAKKIVEKEKKLLKQLYYYTAPPFQSNNPSPEEKKRKERYDLFISKLKAESKMRVREGRCQRLKLEGRYVFKQKGVDTLMTMDLVYAPIEHTGIKEIILIASDSDFVPVIEKLKKVGIQSTLYTYFERKRNSIFSTSNNLLKSVSKVVQLTEKDFMNNLR